MDALLTASDAIFDALIADKLTCDDIRTDDAEAQSRQWKKLSLRLDIRELGLMDFSRSDN